MTEGARELHVCGFKHIRDNQPRFQEMTFDDLVRRLAAPKVLREACRTPEKCGKTCLGKCICPGVTGAKFTGKRSKTNVEELHFLCLDFDNDGARPLKVAEVEAALQRRQVRYLIHTTLSHREEHPKFRVLLEVAKPIPAALYEKAMAWAVGEVAQGGIEPKRLRAALDETLLKGSHVHQMYLVPAHREGRPAPYVGHQLEGEPLHPPLDRLRAEAEAEALQGEAEREARRQAAVDALGLDDETNAAWERAKAEIRTRADLVEIAGRFTELKRAGNEYQGLCPLHEEKTPSFSVSPEKGVFHCFGCGAGGDVFKFLQQKTGRGFLDLVKDLAGSYGIPLPDLTRQRRSRSRRASNVVELISRRTLDGKAQPEVEEERSILRHRQTDLANSEWLVEAEGEQLRFCKPWGRWLAWDGKRWKTDEEGDAERRAKAIARRMHREAQACLKDGADPRDLKGLLAWVKVSQMAPRLRAMLEVAQSEPGIPVLPDQLDQDTWALNVTNGTLDLKTGDLRPHRRTDLITKLVPVPYHPRATCPRWGAFLERAMGGRKELIAYLRRVMGYALTGSIREQCFFFLYGTGANGKSTFLDVLRDLMGDYAQHMPTEALLTKSYTSSGPTPELARLKGVRYATAVEAEAGRRLAESLIKQMTGGEPLAARFNRQDTFEFRPSHKLFLAANHRPEIRGTDHAIWRRVHTVPFEVTIPDHEKDPDLPRKLKEEFPGILAWAVQGCLEWQEKGLAVPEAVVLATQEYRGDMDILGDFLEERCLISEHVRARNTDLYVEYERWCQESRREAVTHKTFSMRLQERGFQNKRTHSGRWWHGVALQGKGPGPDDDERD